MHDCKLPLPFLCTVIVLFSLHFLSHGGEVALLRRLSRIYRSWLSAPVSAFFLSARPQPSFRHAPLRLAEASTLARSSPDRFGHEKKNNKKFRLRPYRTVQLRDKLIRSNIFRAVFDLNAINPISYLHAVGSPHRYTALHLYEHERKSGSLAPVHTSGEKSS